MRFYVTTLQRRGLNIGSLKAKNWALLGKLWWRFSTKTDTFWVKIIKSIYGRDGWLGSTNINRAVYGHSTWKDVIKKDISKYDIMFNNSFVRTIGKGRNTLFWNDTWAGERCFKDRFLRLYRLDEHKDAFVCDRVIWNDATVTLNWQWSRTPQGRNCDDIQEITQVINSAVHDGNVQDGWRWKLSEDGKFHTKILADQLDLNLHGDSASGIETTRNNLLPQSIGIFVWRAKRRRLPFKVELDNRGIDLHTVRCPMCDEDVESTDHAFILCKYAFDLWENIYRWWGLGTFSITSVNELFNGVGFNSSGSIGKLLWQAVEWVCGYLIWKNRNQNVFNNTSRSCATLFNDIQVKSYEWVTKRVKKINIE
ncbi:uncharacterized protein [Rutidosis leptorrhynchoides]|uniref:uncharacterized protein n=1 Tax=Rutidosis leptorrhynchoides TaxID=125765 RepID=UPI003A9937EC